VQALGWRALTPPSAPLYRPSGGTGVREGSLTHGLEVVK